MKIIVAGDYCPQHRITRLIELNNLEEIFGELREKVNQADYSIVNLECPVMNGGDTTPIKKCGPSLFCTEKGIEALKWIGFDCVTLANNHILDYGENGINGVQTACIKYGLDTVGGGENSEKASRILYKDIKGEILAIINCCEHEFSISSDDKAGSNPLNPIQQYYDIQEAKKNAHFILVIVHGGNEYYQLPSPRMKETYRFFIDAGADAVVNHHQHYFSGYEIYKEKPIVYGLGNLCFDKLSFNDEKWTKGYMVCVDLKSSIKLELIPYIQCAKDPCIRLLGSDEAKTFNEEILRINNTIQNNKLLTEEYDSFLKESESIMRILFSPYSGRITRGLCHRKLLPSFITKVKKLELLSYIQCESQITKVIHFLNK